MRYKVLIVIFLILAALHFATGPVLCTLYNKNAGGIIGFPTSVKKISVDLFNRMITLKDITVSSGAQQSGDLITIDTAVISFDLIPLLSRRIRIDELSLNDIRVNFENNQPLLEKLSKNIAAQYAVLQDRMQRTHTPDLPRATYRVRKAASGHDVIYRIVKVEPTLVFNEIKVTNVTVDFGPSEEDPRPPALTDLDLAVRYLTPETLLARQETAFECGGKLRDQPGSHLSFSGSCRQRTDNFAMTAALRIQNVELPDLWPYLTGVMKDPDLASLLVNTGVIDLTADISAGDNESNVTATAKFSRLNIASVSWAEHEPLGGENRKTVIDAINAAGDFSIEFTDIEQWKRAFREVVMKGVRNLIRKAIREAIFGK